MRLKNTFWNGGPRSRPLEGNGSRSKGDLFLQGLQEVHNKENSEFRRERDTGGGPARFSGACGHGGRGVRFGLGTTYQCTSNSTGNSLGSDRSDEVSLPFHFSIRFPGPRRLTPLVHAPPDLPRPEGMALPLAFPPSVLPVVQLKDWKKVISRT